MSDEHWSLSHADFTPKALQGTPQISALVGALGELCRYKSCIAGLVSERVENAGPNATFW